MNSGRRVWRLAKEAGQDPEIVLGQLRRSGLRLNQVNALVSQRDLPEARRILGLDILNLVEPVQSPDGGLAQEHTASTPEPKPARSATRHVRSEREKRTLIGKRPKGEIAYLTADMVEKVHYALVDDFKSSGDPIDPPGCRDGRMYLESAIGRPLTSLGRELKYPTVQMAGAALLHALVHDHPFHNGNKRTAIVSLLVFLDSNGYVFTATEDELYDYVLRLAAHRTISGRDADSETSETARWVNSFSRKRRSGQKLMKYRDLFPILNDYGCELAVKTGNRLDISRGDRKVQVGYRNDGQEVDVRTIGRIRKALELDEEHGIDSEVFYYSGERISGFINTYRQTLKRLAYL